MAPAPQSRKMHSVFFTIFFSALCIKQQFLNLSLIHI